MISKNEVLINANFNGDKIVVFGQKQSLGEVVVILKSNRTNFKVYGKKKMFGTWQNSSPVIFNDIYHTYLIYTETKNIFNSSEIFEDLEIGMHNIHFPNQEDKYKNGFLKKEIQDGFFAEYHGGVESPTNSDLYFAEIDIPANIKPGKYYLEVFLVNEKDIKNFEVFNISIKRVGMLSYIKSLSTDHKIIYGIVAILLSIVFGFASFFITQIFYHKKSSR